MRRRPLELLPLTPAPQPHQFQATAPLPETTTTPVRATTDRSSPGTARIASALSCMAIGAMVTLLVLWSMGTWSAAAEPELLVTPPAAEPASRAELPVTGSQAASQTVPQAAPPELAPAGEAVVQRPDPVQVEIPAIGVSAGTIPLGTDDTGALQVPEDFALTGWWTGGPEPGEIGPAVVVGHVDSYLGPAVFFSLDRLSYDDAIIVTRADGSSATFAVRTAMRVDKSDFPTELVYGPTDDAQLRLVTCDGDFADGSYLGNLIVTAELVREDPPPSEGVIY